LTALTIPLAEKSLINDQIQMSMTKKKRLMQLAPGDDSRASDGTGPEKSRNRAFKKRFVVTVMPIMNIAHGYLNPTVTKFK
jgi:hypothetical protein